MNKKRYLVIAVVVAAAVLLSILFYTVLANHRPAITSLTAEPETVLPRGSCLIVCNATDPDGDELSYGWSPAGGGITGEGAEVTWTAPNSVGSYNVTVIVVDGRGGEATDYVTITVRDNRPPIINSLIADAYWTTPSGNLQVTCNATDPDGDELSYTWLATGGSITGTGTEVIWSAPEEVGTYDVTVFVTDVLGWSDMRSITLIASNGPPPIIENLVVTAKEPKYLKKNSTGYTVGQTKEYYIECILSDASGGVSYEWSRTGGEISGEGSMITWIAPNTGGTVTVTVTASDIAGNKASKSILFTVAPCNSCTFG
jgi:hypothetical protein